MQFVVDSFYYGFAEGEFVRWAVGPEGQLMIWTQRGHRIYIASNHWAWTSALLGPGKIDTKFIHDGTMRTIRIKICPVRENVANDSTFESGINGPLNLRERRFSSSLGEGQAIFYPTN